MANENKEFWDNFYKSVKNIDDNSLFAQFVYDKYINKYNTENICLKIADLGCGNCRDSNYFAKKNNICYAVDINGVNNFNNDNLKLVLDDVESVLINYKLQTLFDIIYMRWFLHAMPYDKSESVVKYAVDNLKSEGLICIEVRSINDSELLKISKYDDNDKSYTSTHKRWLYNIDMCEELAKNNNCEILFCEEGHFSPNNETETSNPLLIRIILKKKTHHNIMNKV